MTPEGRRKEIFRKSAKKHNLKYVNLIVTGNDGEPDKIAFPPGGRCVLCEFKSDDGGLSPAQRYKITLYRMLGYRVEIVDTDEAARDLPRELTQNHAI